LHVWWDAHWPSTGLCPTACRSREFHCGAQRWDAQQHRLWWGYFTLDSEGRN
jgi:hypothetical protein